jgi:hypothetical protein
MHLKEMDSEVVDRIHLAVDKVPRWDCCVPGNES